jgi:hypothetical protein
LKAQVTVQDRDSTTIYHDIYNYSKRGKFSKFMYRLFFRPSHLTTTTIINKEKEEESQKKQEKLHQAHSISSGKVIRNIYIKTLDPFGYSITDTTQVPNSSFEHFGNAVHAKTKEFTVKNLLLFKKNDPCDTLKLQESERLIRSQRYVRRVTILPQPTESQDSVDVYVTLLDSWSLIPTGNLTSSDWEAKLTERNILGYGHRISGSYKKEFSSPRDAHYAQYTINNIKNSYISFDLTYQKDYDSNSSRTIGLTRNFFSPLTKNAGGIYFENREATENFVYPDSTYRQTVKSEYQEYWYGRAFKILNPNTYLGKTTNLITSITFNKKIYTVVPDPTFDPTSFFASENNIIGQLAFTAQKYYKDSYLFNYGITEDVPYGSIYALIFGKQTKNGDNRSYFGAKFSKGKRYPFGYLTASTEWGSFINDGKTEQLAFSVGFQYISPLWNIGSWRFRQFIKPSYTWGNNRNPSVKDQLTLNGTNGLQNFTDGLVGTQRWLLALQMQTYVPKNWYGFHFSPYANFTFGALADNSKNLFQSRIFPKFSLGVLINNDYLVFNSFQISFSFYPSIPYEGENVLKTNSLENNDLKLSDYQVGKPSYISYQ